jgi:hypothetical protein
MIPKRFLTHKQGISPVENENPGNVSLKNNQLMSINQFFKNPANNNTKEKGNVKEKKVDSNGHEELYSNSLEKIWDVGQLVIDKSRKKTDKNNKQLIEIKRENSMEMNRFEDFSRIDFDESESELESKKVDDLNEKAIKRQKRPIGGKIENKKNASEELY